MGKILFCVLTLAICFSTVHGQIFGFRPSPNPVKQPEEDKVEIRGLGSLFGGNLLSFIPDTVNRANGVFQEVFGRPRPQPQQPNSAVMSSTSSPASTSAPDSSPASTSSPDSSPASTSSPASSPASTSSPASSNTERPSLMNQCNTPDGNPGYCVGIRQCEELLRLIKEIPRNPSAKSFLQRSLCWYEGKDPVVCCARSYQTLPTAPPETMTEPTNPITQPKPETTSAPIVSTEEPLAPKDNPLDLPSPGECGVGAKFTRRVVGGVPAELGDYPWMAVLGYRSQRRPGEARWLCGGTLVSRSHVVTAAHCIDRHEDDLYLVRLGELNLERDDDGASPVDAPIARMSKHPEYSPKMYTNDIGLLTLAQIITFNSLLSPICLPTDPMIRTRDFVDYNPFLAGWGDTQFRGPQSPQLQVVQLPVVSNERCRNAYASFKRQVIDERVLCAGYAQGGRDACQGDSGGPLMQPVQSRTGNRTSYFYLIGVVSYGHKCAEPGFPGVYTRVTHFIPWLEQEMSKD